MTTATKVNYGEITDETPIGRRFLFDPPVEDAAAETIYDFLIYLGDEDIRGVPFHVLTDEEDEEDPGVYHWSQEEWNEKFAPFCTGYKDPDDGTMTLEDDDPDHDRKLTSEDEILLFSKRKEIRVAKREEERLHEDYKDAKKKREKLEEDMGEWLDAIEEGPGPLFGSPDDTEQQLDPDNEDLTESERGVLLANITNPAILPKYLKALQENKPSITTLGQLVDWQREKGDFWAKDIKGLGPSACDNISDVMIGVWTRRKKQMDKDEKLLNDVNK